MNNLIDFSMMESTHVPEDLIISLGNNKFSFSYKISKWILIDPSKDRIRSALMSRIGPRDTKPEMILRSAFTEEVSDSELHLKNSQENLIWSFLAIEQLFSFMVVFGTDIEDVRKVQCQRRI